MGGSSGRSREAEKKAVLTPNVTYLRSAYHDGHRDRPDPVQSGSGVSSVPSAPQNLALALSDPVDTRWHFRADPGPGLAQAPLADARLYWPVLDSRAPDLTRVRHHHRTPLLLVVPSFWSLVLNRWSDHPGGRGLLRQLSATCVQRLGGRTDFKISLGRQAGPQRSLSVRDMVTTSQF